MTNTYKQLGQSRPSTTTSESLYSPSTSTEAIIKSVIICNTSGADANCSLFVDDDGTTYDEATALAWNVTVAANSSPLVLSLHILMNNANGNLGIKTDTANALTFTIFGMEKNG